MAILSKERKKNFNDFKKAAKAAIKDLIKQEKHEPTKQLYRGLLNSIETTGIYFYDSDVLAASDRGRIMGLSQRSIVYIKRGNKIEFRLGPTTISMPAGHLFYGHHLTLDGITTMIHEWAHYPKKIGGFARMLRLPAHAAEEFLADVVSAKVALRLGFKPQYVFRHYHGRIPLFIVYGFDYMKMLKKLVGA
jgi:hypothetical protein